MIIINVENSTDISKFPERPFIEHYNGKVYGNWVSDKPILNEINGDTFDGGHAMILLAVKGLNICQRTRPIIR